MKKHKIFCAQLYIIYSNTILNCISDGFLLIIAGDITFPKDKRCFISTLCLTVPELCNHTCIGTLGFQKGGACYNNQGICRCNLTF